MTDGDATSKSELARDPAKRAAYLAAIRREDWGNAALAVTCLLKERHVREADWDRMLSEVTLRVMDPARSPYLPEEHPSFILHVLSVASSIIYNVRKKVEPKRYVPMGDEMLEPVPESERDVEKDALASERARRARVALEARLVNHPLALKVLALEERYVSVPQEQATALGVTVRQVYKAREALFQAVRELGRSSSDSDIRVAMGGTRTREPQESEEAP